MSKDSKPIEIENVSAWNAALRGAKADGRTVIVDFHAQWCGPCKAIAPMYSELASTHPHVTFLRVDTDKQQRIAAKYEIKAMPTFIAIVDGEVKDTLRGADPRGLKRLLKQHEGSPLPKLPAAAEEAKKAGNDAFKAGDWEDAYAKYSDAIQVAPTSAVLFGNRSAALLKASRIDEAVADGLQATVLDDKWAKGWYRYAEALDAKEPKDKYLVAETYLRAYKGMPDGIGKTECKGKLDAAQKAVKS